MAEHEKKDPCAGLPVMERINCMEKQAIGRVVETKSEPKKGPISSTPPPSVKSAPASPRSQQDEDDILQSLSPMARKEYERRKREGK